MIHPSLSHCAPYIGNDFHLFPSLAVGRGNVIWYLGKEYFTGFMSHGPKEGQSLVLSQSVYDFRIHVQCIVEIIPCVVNVAIGNPYVLVQIFVDCDSQLQCQWVSSCLSTFIMMSKGDVYVVHTN